MECSEANGFIGVAVLNNTTFLLIRRLRYIMVLLACAISSASLAEDCSVYLQLKHQAASGYGNLSALYQYQQQENECYLRNSQVIPVQPIPVPPQLQNNHSNDNAKIQDGLIIRALGKLSNMLESPRKGLFGSQRLSDALGTSGCAHRVIATTYSN